jgi:hypothetical protein
MPRQQHTALDQLRRVARLARYRVSTDPEGFPVIPGRYGGLSGSTGMTSPSTAATPASSRRSVRPPASADTRPATRRCGRSSPPRRSSRWRQ